MKFEEVEDMPVQARTLTSCTMAMQGLAPQKTFWTLSMAIKSVTIEFRETNDRTSSKSSQPRPKP